MSEQVKVPPLGDSVTEATILKWHKNPGDQVKVDELLVVLETDKIAVEVNAPSNGVVTSTHYPEGAKVEVGMILCSIDTTNVGATIPTPSAAAVVTPMAATAPTVVMPEKIASPAAQKIANENNQDLSKISGSGKDERITKGDVLNAINTGSISTVTPVQSETCSTDHICEERVKMSKMRQTIARRLKDAQNTAAILTTFNEVDMSNVIRMRKVYQDKFTDTHGIKIGFMSFFVKAAVQALKEIPAVNAEISGEDIVYKNHYDISVAVGTAQGLVVPVVRDANKLSFAEIEKKIVELGKKARDGKLSIQDMKGGTFTITNGGIYGSMLSTPIINPPQSAILGMHNIVERPCVVDGQIVIRPMMYVALSYDHRIIDGREAVTFLVRIKELIENIERLLLDI